MSKVIDETEVQGQVRMVTPSLPGYLFVARTKDTRAGVSSPAEPSAKEKLLRFAR